MRQAIGDRGAFAHWLRTGALPRVQSADGVELKFNPWHDPDDGRFTFANTGVHYGRGSRGVGKASQRAGVKRREAPVERGDDLVVEAKLQTIDDARSLSKAEFQTFESMAKAGDWDSARENAEIHEYVRQRRARAARTARERAGEEAWARQGRDFARLYAETAAMEAAGVGAGRFVIAPAVRRAAPIVERLVRPQAHARKPAERTPGPPPSTPAWVDENASMKPRTRRYNDAATGARSNPSTKRASASALYHHRNWQEKARSLRRLRGWSLYADGRSENQYLFYAEGQGSSASTISILKENNRRGQWEVPDKKTKRKAIRLLRDLDIDNIGVKVVPE